MTVIRWCCVIVLGLAASPAQGQDVYRCKGANGETAFSSKPCSPDAKPITLRHSAPASGGDTSGQSGEADMAARGSVAIREQQCIRSADASIRDPAADRIAGYRARIRTLENGLRYAQNNQAGATWSAGLRQEIAALQQSITTEETSAETLAQAAYQRCRDERQRAEDALDKPD